MHNTRTLRDLFIAFFKIGAFTFGGGYAMIPLIQREAVENHGWISDDDILEIVAIAESTPGPIAINAATFVGYRTAGVLGAACATTGIVLPSFTIIYLLSFVLREFSRLRAVQYAFFGIRAGVLALLCKALLMMYKKCRKSAVAYGVMAFSFAAVVLFDLNILLVILCCAGTGIASTLLIPEKEGKA